MSLLSFSQGSCTLVGAGPGDPELLTIKAVKAIQAATVLLVDDLVVTGWTLTLAATSLREAGADAVLPLALATQA